MNDLLDNWQVTFFCERTDVHPHSSTYDITLIQLLERCNNRDLEWQQDFGMVLT